MLLLRASQNLVSSLLARPGVYFVDSANGNDSNAGFTQAKPLKTLAGMKTKHGNSTYAATVNVLAPQASPLREQLVWDKALPLTVQPVPSQANWFLYASEKFTSGWTLASSIYSRAVTGYTTGCNGVLVSTLTDNDGNWVRLIENTATPTTPAAGEYGQDITAGTGTIYVRLPGSVSANSHTIECAKNDYGLWARRAATVTVKHARTYCANVAGIRTGGTTGGDDGATVVEDSESWYANVGGFATAAGVWTSAAYTRCGSFANLNDGFNVHGGESGGAPTGAQICTMTNCEAAYNRDEGCSAHDRTTVNQSGGRMHHNNSGGITHINNVATAISGVEIDHNQRTNLASDSGGANFLDSVSGSMTGCNVHDNPHEGIRKYVGTTITVSGNTSGVANGNGLADNLAA